MNGLGELENPPQLDGEGDFATLLLMITVKFDFLGF